MRRLSRPVFGLIEMESDATIVVNVTEAFVPRGA